MIVSFAWTTPALLAGAKTMTRRAWTPRHAAQFHVGDVVDAWNQTPRVNSRRLGIEIARKVATIRITNVRGPESTAFVGDDDFDREGFNWLRAHGSPEDRGRVQTIWTQWRFAPQQLYVIDFELVERGA